MDDNEKKPIIHTLQTLFKEHANNIYWNPNADIDIEIENEEFDAILLGQIDFWLNMANLMGTVFSLTETGLAYMEFKKWRLDYKDFMQFLNMICEGKEIKEDKVKQLLLEAGPPPTPENVVVK